MIRTSSFLGRELRLLGGLIRGAFFDCEILLSYACNLTCTFCSFWKKGISDGRSLSVPECERISGELAQEGSLVVSLEGGEPLMVPDIEEIIRAFARHHLPILYTNGTQVDRHRARRLFDAGLYQAAVSLDYAGADRHDHNRGRHGVHAEAVAALRALAQVAPRGGRQVHAFTVLMDDNVAGLEDLLELTRTLGVEHQVTVIARSGLGRHPGERKGPPPGVGRRLDELREKFEHLVTFRSYTEGMDRWLSGQETPDCRAGLQTLTVDPTGRVYACNEMVTEPVGNLLEEKWSTVRARLQAQFQPRTCNQCYTLCRGVGEALGGGLGPMRLFQLIRERGLVLLPRKM